MILVIVLLPLILLLGKGLKQLFIDLTVSIKDGEIDDEELEKIKASLNRVTKAFLAILSVFSIKVSVSELKL